MRKTLSELEEEIKILNRQINDQLIQIKKLQEDLHKAEECIKQLDKTMVSFISHE
jgi:hypothetical protein